MLAVLLDLRGGFFLLGCDSCLEDLARLEHVSEIHQSLLSLLNLKVRLVYVFGVLES